MDSVNDPALLTEPDILNSDNISSTPENINQSVVIDNAVDNALHIYIQVLKYTPLD